MLLLEVSPPQDGAVAAKVVEALRGKAPADGPLLLHTEADRKAGPREVEAAFGGAKTAPAVLALAEPRAKEDPQAPAGAIQIGTAWFAVHRAGGKLVLDEDKQELFSVWAGSAATLAAAVRYVQADPLASFPVRSDLIWAGEQDLGKLPAPANGCQAVDLGPPAGPCALVLSDAGDRLYRPAKDGKLADAAAELKLATASRHAAAGDFDFDGRLDLASWDGRRVRLATRAPDGTFAPPKDLAPLAECLSLACVEVDGKAALLAGTPAGPVLLKADGQPPRALVPVADAKSAEALGPAGPCVTADFDADGGWDCLQLHPRGAALYAGSGGGRLKAPRMIPLALMPNPRAAVCGDFDTDGRLDVLVGGEGAIVLLSRDAAGRWTDQTPVTGELAYHGGQNAPRVIAAALGDVNGDGRQGMALLYAARKPMLFFNRGFACFGWARELDLAGPAQALDAGGLFDAPDEPREKLKGLDALQHGQSAGMLADLNADGLADLLAVAAGTHEVRLLLGGREDRQPVRNVIASLPPGQAGPVTLTVRDGQRVVGMYVVRAGGPATIGRPRAGPVTIEWTAPDGKAHSRKVVVVRGAAPVELGP